MYNLAITVKSNEIELIVNGLPTSPIVSIDPDTPVSDDDLAVVIATDSVDPDSEETPDYSYAWTKNDSEEVVSTTSPQIRFHHRRPLVFFLRLCS